MTGPTRRTPGGDRGFDQETTRRAGHPQHTPPPSGTYTLCDLIELAAGIEHERQTYRRCVEREHDLRAQLREVEDRRLEAFGNLALFGRSPFVPEFVHHRPPSDPASDAAFAQLGEVA